ncbi:MULTISPECIES: sigma-70 family RNA polymerase sigma factor [unclassified Nocardiopsis]|uniref:sigma-70 family RNA polymerase sigma factor n=1 Tax=unclassified Nocardiopsis TaxID=2649073 RepID=UPI00135B256D|nr:MULTISPECIES: sigma-70 family RNA polymerase sigma factor [unclassified Nocardiopsis]
MPTDTALARPRVPGHARPGPQRAPRAVRPRPHDPDSPRDPGAAPSAGPREKDDLDRLARSARDGSSAALDAFVRHTRPDVVRFISRRVPSDRVEELTQETYLRALRGLPRFVGRAPARAWLLAIARNTVADRYRHDAARPACVPPPDWDLLPARAARFDEHLALRALVDGLTPERRQAFVLTQVEGMTYAEAARTAGVPVGTIRSRVARAREDLLRELNA